MLDDEFLIENWYEFERVWMNCDPGKRRLGFEDDEVLHRVLQILWLLICFCGERENESVYDDV